MTYGCIFCRTGKERALAESIRESFPHMETLVPQKMRIRRTAEETREEAVALFPGYVFFRTEKITLALEGAPPAEGARDARAAFPVEFQQIYRWSDTYRLLTNVDGDWRLTGPDRAMAEKLYQAGGLIGFSKVCFDKGNRIRVLEGFLKDYEGDIIRVDRRHRTAQIRTSFQGKIITMWLGYEVIEGI